ncbi:MAG: hypothetical protein KUG68_09130, partial [Flavobacteriaceae bacterium]|nr:hypothetical protein [Flavobacteriaceae bacterium]
MIKKLFFLVALSISLISCQFTETLQLNEDGSGRMAIVMDMGELMAMGGDMMKDSIPTKLDTIISMKTFLDEKKDSISQLSEEKQMQLKKLENYHIQTVMDTEKGEMVFNMYTDFKSINEANDIFNGLGQTKSLMPNMGDHDGMNNEDEEENEVIGVSYSYKNKKFIRDSYIKDVEKHQQEVDSLKKTESFMGAMRYKLKYSFPSKIVKSSIDDAKFSLDGKTIEVEASFIDYFK